MGAAQSKTAAMRTPPARYVAHQMPRPLKAVEEEFAKAKHTIQGINQLTEKVSTTPQPYVETKQDTESTEVSEHAAPRWYVNTWLELMDNTREDRMIYTGNLPSAWFRDHYEPYTLVRNRIDDEDLDWLLTEGKKLPMEQLVECTKLERSTLEDILATVEAPRKQFRNYKGKLRKAIDDPNEYLADRKKRIEENRDEEILRSIGFSDEDIADEKQYQTNRSRGVKTLDELGASIRQRKRSDRAAQHNDMQALLDERRVMQIEAGEVEPSQEEMMRPTELVAQRETAKGYFYKAREQPNKALYRMDHNHPSEKRKMQNIKWWQARRTNINRGPDHIPDMPVYNERLSQTEGEMKEFMAQESERNEKMARAQGSKMRADPREGFGDILEGQRAAKREAEFVDQAVKVHGKTESDARREFAEMELAEERQRRDDALSSQKGGGAGHLSKAYQPRRREGDSPVPAAMDGATDGSWFSPTSYSSVTTPVTPLDADKKPVVPPSSGSDDDK